MKIQSVSVFSAIFSNQFRIGVSYSLYYMGLCTGCFTNETSFIERAFFIASFIDHFKRIIEIRYMSTFSFNPKLS